MNFLTVCRSRLKMTRVVKATRMKMGRRLNHASSIPNRSPVEWNGNCTHRLQTVDSRVVHGHYILGTGTLYEYK